MKPIKIVCIGDSLTEGYGINENDSWCSLLNENPKIDIVNSGISGDTTAGMLARFQSMVIDHHPKFVVIMGGTNDLWFETPIRQIISNILAMTRIARHHSIHAIIGIPTPVFCEGDIARKSVWIDPDHLVEQMNIYQKELLTFIKDDGLDFIDFSKNMNADCFLEDGVHPNTAGHIEMHRQAFAKISNLLSL